jgi:hypothetical protein
LAIDRENFASFKYNAILRERIERVMILLLNIGRALMVAWVVYGLLLIFAPSVIHKPPSQTNGFIQVAIAYTLGYLMDRALGQVRRRRAKAAVDDASMSGSDDP